MLNQINQKIKLFEHQTSPNSGQTLRMPVLTSKKQPKFPNHTSIKASICFTH